jgi:hypothetical protein
MGLEAIAAESLESPLKFPCPFALVAAEALGVSTGFEEVRADLLESPPQSSAFRTLPAMGLAGAWFGPDPVRGCSPDSPLPGLPGDQDRLSRELYPSRNRDLRCA